MTMSACKSGNEKAVLHLLKDSDVSLVNQEGRTLLHEALLTPNGHISHSYISAIVRSLYDTSPALLHKVRGHLR